MMYQIRRLISLLIVFAMGIQTGYPQSPRCLAPHSEIFKASHLTELSPSQRDYLTQIFLNSELKSVLDTIVMQVLRNMKDQFESEMILLSTRPFFSLDKSGELQMKMPTKRGKKRKKKGLPLGTWINASVAEHLLRDIRLREITYRNKMRLEGKWNDEIEQDLEEFRKIMPTDGIEVYVVKGIYILAFKEFILFYSENAPDSQKGLPVELQAVISAGKVVFEEKSHRRWSMTIVQMPEIERLKFCRNWSSLELAEKPTDEMLETLGQLNHFIPLIRQTLHRVQQDLQNLVAAAQSAGTQPKEKQDEFLAKLQSWIETIDGISSDSDDFARMPSHKTSDSILKVSEGIHILTQLRQLFRQIAFEFSTQNGDLAFEPAESAPFYQRFNLEALKESLGLPTVEAAHEYMEGLLSSLNRETRDLNIKLNRLRKISETVDVSVPELVRNIVRDYGQDAASYGIEMTLDLPSTTNEKVLSVVSRPLELDLVLRMMTEDTLSRISQKTGNGNQRLVFSVSREKGGDGKVGVSLTVEKNDSIIKSRRLSKRIQPARFDLLNLDAVVSRIDGEIATSNNKQTLRVPQQLKADSKNALSLPTENLSKGWETLSHDQFHQALNRYINKKTNKKLFRSLVSPEMVAEIHALNQLGNFTFETVSIMLGRNEKELLKDLVTSARVSSRSAFPHNRRMTLRELADQTGLRLSEVAELLKIPPKVASEKIPLPVMTIEAKHLNTIEEYFQRKLKEMRLPDEGLLMIRLLVPDPAGNLVEQVIIDRLSRIKENIKTLSKAASFNKFLFNARRTFDRRAREIIFNEIYVDPQGKGYGNHFYQEQSKLFLKAGFKGVRLREDTVSLATLSWLDGARIDWEKLAFKEHWLKSMKSLFDALGIDITSGPVTTEKIRDALKQAKMNSNGFETFLKALFDTDINPDAEELVRILRESEENGYVEFLHFRLLGYGRRKIIMDHAQRAIAALPESCGEEKEQALDALEDEKKDFWSQIQDALNKVEEAAGKAGISVVTKLPNFEKGSPERRLVYQAAEKLLQEHEFGLSLVSHLSGDYPRKSKNQDFMEVLTRIYKDFFAAGETVAPNFIDSFAGLDRERDRFNRFWRKGWPKPNKFQLRVAQAFHEQIAQADLTAFHVIGSRVYSTEVSDLFFSNPIIRQMLAERDGALGVARILIALFYYNPQLAGIVLRSSQNYLQETLLALSHFPDTMIAKILDLELIPVPKNQLRVFQETDRFHLLALLEPNEISSAAYSRRVKEVIQLVQPKTLALLLQQSCRLNESSASRMEGWVKSVFLNALRGMESQEIFLKAMDLLKAKDKLNDPDAWNWVNDYFRNKNLKTEPVTIAQWVNSARNHLDSEHSRVVAGKKYNRVDFYGSFMQFFDGFVDPLSVTAESVESQTNAAAAALSEIYRTDPEVAGLIVRSTENSYDKDTLQILCRMPVSDFVGILDQELSPGGKPFYLYPAQEKIFRKLDRFIVLIFIRYILNFSRQDSTMLSPVWVQDILGRLRPESVASLVQQMHWSAANERFRGIHQNLREIKELLDSSQPQRWHEVTALLKKYDAEVESSELWDVETKRKIKVGKWLRRVLEGENYSKDFFSRLRAEQNWVDQSFIASEIAVIEKFKRTLTLLSQGEETIFSREEEAAIENYFQRVIGALEKGDENGACLSFGKFKMEYHRMRDQLVSLYEEGELNEKQRLFFVFALIEEEMDSYFEKSVIRAKGLSGFEKVTPGKRILRVKVLRNTPEEAGKYRHVRKADLIVTDAFPENDPLITTPGAILMGIPVSANGHAYELVKAWNIPSGFLPSAQELLKNLNGEIVVLDMDLTQPTLRLANQSEKSQFEKDLPALDVEVTAFSRLQIPDVYLGDDEAFVLNLDEIKPSDRSRVGYKATRLGRLKQGGFPVPPGFALTFQAYQAFLKHNRIEESIEEALRGIDRLEEEQIRTRLASIQNQFIYGAYPPELEAQIRAQLKILGNVNLFVRSSSNVEDLPGFSGAGRLDSFGPMPNNDAVVLAKIKEVMLSLWKSRAFDNRRAHGVVDTEHLRAKASVIVQQAVDAAYSGLVATRHSGDPNKIEITIDEKVKGGVEDKVVGRTAPYILFDAQTGKVERHFQDHPLFRDDAKIGLADLFELIRQKLPQLDDAGQMEVVKIVLRKEEKALAHYLVGKISEEKVEELAKALLEKLTAISQTQRRELFDPLFQMAQKTENSFQLAPVLIEFAVDAQGTVIPLQVKGHEGSRKISFDVLITHVYGLHVRPATNLVLSLRDYVPQNQIYIGRVDREGKSHPSNWIKIDNVKKNTIDVLALGAEAGTRLRFVVSGKDAFEIAQKLRAFFFELCHDYDNEEEMKSMTAIHLTWEESLSIYGRYFEEDDDSKWISFGDEPTLFQIYQKMFDAKLSKPSQELEAAI